MATFIHITDEKYEKSIRTNGIKIGKVNKAIFFMPVFDEYLISHQWARELKRSGTKNFMAVYFKIESNETVWFGHFAKGHKQVQLSQAMEEFLKLDDKLGYEMIIERKIEAKEISKIKTIPKPMGWRYAPYAHKRAPCPCPVCIQKGGYKTASLREKEEKLSFTEAKEILLNSTDVDELEMALYDFMGKQRKESPLYLERLLHIDDEWVLYALVKCVDEFRDPLKKDYLEVLSNSKYEDVAELAVEYLDNLEEKK